MTANEEPVPPRQIDPSIHPGISAVVMRALEKEPEQRYQNCREMLEDLRKYRTLAPGGNSQSTMAMGGRSPGATLVSGNSAGRGFTGEDQTVVATARSLNARASAPGQTPVVRRTGTIAHAPEVPKKNVFGTILAALLLLGVIIYGANKIRPVFQAARELHDAQKKGGSLPPAAPATSETTPDSPAARPSGTDNSAQPKEAVAAAGGGGGGKTLESKTAENAAAQGAPRK